MKRTLTALAAAGFLAVMAGPALAGSGCGGWSTHTAGLAERSGDPSTQTGQSTPAPTPVPTQTASTDEKSE